jgi:predicted nucleic acid-binding protein
MAVLLFPDNTVLINFATISRMDLLERLANGNGRWCATVASECTESANTPGLGALVDARRIFGDPLYPQGAEYQDMLLLREELASPGDPRHKHLGEAETLAIMLRRHVNGFFVTDDAEARRLATKNGVQVVTTWRLLLVAVRNGWVDADALWGYVQTLGRAHRGKPPGVYDRATFDKWTAGHTPGG